MIVAHFDAVLFKIGQRIEFCKQTKTKKSLPDKRSFVEMNSREPSDDVVAEETSFERVLFSSKTAVDLS